MIILSVPKFNPVWPIGSKHHSYEFKGYSEVEVNDEPTSDDYQKVCTLLPGMPCGYCPALYEIGKTNEKIPISRFYDSRQRGVSVLKNYFITIKQ